MNRKNPNTWKTPPEWDPKWDCDKEFELLRTFSNAWRKIKNCRSELSWETEGYPFVETFYKNDKVGEITVNRMGEYEMHPSMGCTYTFPTMIEALRKLKEWTSTWLKLQKEKKAQEKLQSTAKISPKSEDGPTQKLKKLA